MAAVDLYLDTSVVGGYFDAAFREDTRRLWMLRARGHCRFLTSVVAVEEVRHAPPKVRRLFGATFAAESILTVNEEANRLATAYLDRSIVSTEYLDDALHVAVCTLARIPLLASWNFKHLANLRSESAFNAANRLHGYPGIRIVRPSIIIHEITTQI